MSHLNWSVAALADLDRIYTFYAEKDRDTGLRAVLTLRREVEILEVFPHLGKSSRKVPYRECTIPFGRRGFRVLYETSGSVVTIAAIRHGLEERYSVDRGARAN